MNTISINELKQYNCPVNDSHDLNIVITSKNRNCVEYTKINQINDFIIHLYNKEKLTQINNDKFLKYNSLQVICKKNCCEYTFSVDNQCHLIPIYFSLYSNKHLMRINLHHTNSYLYRITNNVGNNICSFYKDGALIEDIKSFYDNLIFI